MIKLKYGCDTSYATCIIVESTPNTQSSLIGEECISQQNFNEDVYEQLEKIQMQSDLSELGEQCLTYTTLNNKNIVKNVILKFEEEICILKNKVEELENRQLCDFPITDCGLNLSCLTDTCDNTIITVGDLLQSIINKVCET